MGFMGIRKELVVFLPAKKNKKRTGCIAGQKINCNQMFCHAGKLSDQTTKEKF